MPGSIDREASLLSSHAPSLPRERVFGRTHASDIRDAPENPLNEAQCQGAPDEGRTKSRPAHEPWQNDAMPADRRAPIPDFLYGTAAKEERTAALTELAPRAGARPIDTANQRRPYFEAGVGQGLATAYRAGIVTRADLFLQTKFTS